jgi:hypothetical protein
VAKALDLTIAGGCPEKVRNTLMQLAEFCFAALA